MVKVPELVAESLRGRGIAVAGVSRNPQQAANAISRKLRKSSYDVIPFNWTFRKAEL
jgi:predicted CoA-binding protein